MAALKSILLCVMVLFAVAASSPIPEPGKHEHYIIHVPYEVHTIHHHHVKKVPVFVKSHYHDHEHHFDGWV